MDVLRRVTAFLAMIALLGLLAILVWEVTMHRVHGSTTDEPALVVLSSHAV